MAAVMDSDVRCRIEDLNPAPTANRNFSPSGAADNAPSGDRFEERRMEPHVPVCHLFQRRILAKNVADRFGRRRADMYDRLETVAHERCTPCRNPDGEKLSNAALLVVLVAVVGAARQPLRNGVALVLFYGSCTAQ